MNEMQKLPLWKNVIELMRKEGLDFEKAWPVDFFETGFSTTKETHHFAFEMLALRKELEDEDGYYLRSAENGARWYIVPANACEDVAKCFETKLNRYARRAIWIRSATLGNDKAKLTEDERRKMKNSEERAATRLVLLSRQTAICKALQEHSPKVLEASIKE